MESLIAYIVPLFIGLGFLVITVAPAWKLFKKAGRRPWLSLIPAANAGTFIKVSGRPIAFIGIFSLLAFSAYWLVIVFFSLPEGAVPPLGLIALFGAVLVVSTYFFGFPLFSVLMLASVTYFFTDIGVLPEGVPLVLSAVLCSLAVVQFLWDAIVWIGWLKKLNRPLWQAAFLFLPFLAAAIDALVGLFIAPVSSEVLLITLAPALFIGFVYYYYLGFSAKVRLLQE